MNVITIQSILDLQYVIDAPLFLIADKSKREQEIEHNMWCIAFEDSYSKRLDISDLESFFERLVIQKKIELKKKYPHKQAILYLWFDQ